MVLDQSTATRITSASTTAEVTYRDKVYTSRTLIMPEGRTLAVARGRVTVTKADTHAVAFLDQQADFELIAE
ncbi:hypothetical protein HCU66_07525 [Pseudomonas frederiksbergensis]|nr:hypothetical protein [Pseudomonas frederiksbergensis]